VRGALPRVRPRPPTDLPASRHFRGTGRAYLNTTLLDAREDVQVVFKSSRFGTWSHGYEANNSFLLWAYGQRLLIRSGRRDMYGSEHHRRWMWSTRSVNNITVDGHGQVPHSMSSKGRIVAFATTPTLDAVVGEAGEAYRVSVGRGQPERRLLNRFTRAILFVKPDLVIVYDRLTAPQPHRYEYWLHAVNRFDVADQRRIRLRCEDVLCEIDFLRPRGLTFRQTNQYDPNPRPRVKLREWHLTAIPPEKARRTEFVVLYRPHRASEPVPTQARLTSIPGGYLLRAAIRGGQVLVLLPTDDGATLRAAGLESRGGDIVIHRLRADGTAVQTLRVPSRAQARQDR